MRKLDIYNHILPAAFIARMKELAPQMGDIVKRVTSIPMLHDMEARTRMMEQWPGYQQVLTLANPPIEAVAGPADSPALARLGNDELRRACATRPDKFPAWAAALPLNNVSAALEEMDRAIALGARGIQIFTNIAGKPLDDPSFRPVFELMAQYDLPIWLHPVRTSAMTDYPAEAKSRFEMWWCFGWPYDTSVAMARLVFSGLFDRHPGIKIVTHHCGGMIPYYDGRVGAGLEVLGSRTSDEDYSQILPSLKRPHLDYFRDFHADTAMFGGQYGVRCGLEFFGADRIVFATDAPLGPIRPTIEAVDRLGVDDADLRKIKSGNAARLLNMPFN